MERHKSQNIRSDMNKEINQSPIYIISSFHYDLIYLKGSAEYLELGCEIINQALTILDDKPEYCFTIEQVFLVREYLKLYPERKESMTRHAKSGRLSFAPGMFVMPDMNMIDGESLFLQTKWGAEFLREQFGVEPDVCWIADCWGHHAQLPQILSLSGFRAYVFTRTMRPEARKNDFLWRGIDGTVILSHWLAAGYAGIYFPAPTAQVCNAEELSFCDASSDKLNALYNRIASFGDNGAVMICNGGDFRVPNASNVDMVEKLNSQKLVPPMRFSTPTEYMKALENKSLDLVDGEFNAAFQGTFSINIRIKQLLYHYRELLLARESYQVLNNSSDVDDLSDMWEIVLKHQFHDTICGTICDDGLREVYRDFDWLAKQLPEDGDAIYNPSSHPCTETVVDSNGTRRLAQLQPFERKMFYDLPLMPQLTECKSRREFVNEYFRVRFRDNGFAESLSCSNGCELISSTSPAAFGALTLQMDYGDNWLIFEGPISGGSDASFLTDNRPDPLLRQPSESGIVDRRTVFPEVLNVKFFHSANELEIVQECELSYWTIKIRYTSVITLSQHSPLIRWRTTMYPTGKHYRLRVAFPTTIINGKVVHEIPFGLQERGFSEFPAQGFCDYSGGNTGLALLNRGIPGNNIDPDGVMLLSIFRSAAMEYKCHSVDSFNDGVPHTFEYAVMPHPGDSIDLVLVPAEHYTKPVQRLPFVPSYIESGSLATPENVRISALRNSRDAVFIRLNEIQGKKCKFTLTLPSCFTRYIPADGIERPAGNTEQIIGSNVFIQLRPFEIRNYLLLRN